MNPENTKEIRKCKDQGGIVSFISAKKDACAAFLKKRRQGNKTFRLVGTGKKTVRELDYNSRQAVILQYRILIDLVKKNADTQFGKEKKRQHWTDGDDSSSAGDLFFLS